MSELLGERVTKVSAAAVEIAEGRQEFGDKQGVKLREAMQPEMDKVVAEHGILMIDRFG